jgi:large subunit ribosomal protein L35
VRAYPGNRGPPLKIPDGRARLYCPPGMPKMKSHSGAKKRFKKTGTGKLQGRHAFSSHILEKKSPKRKREMGLDREISKADRKVVTKLLGGNGR